MGDTTDIKKGAVIRHNNDLYVVTFCQFVNPGKGTAFTKTKLKGISNGKGTEITYKSGETVDVVDVYRKSMQYLYKGDISYSFMDQETFEAVEIDTDIVGDDGQYLKEGINVIVSLHDGRAVAIELPKKITYTVVEAAAAVKGDTAGGNVTKEVKLDNGLMMHVPIFITEGDNITVNTGTGEYGGRAIED